MQKLMSKHKPTHVTWAAMKYRCTATKVDRAVYLNIDYDPRWLVYENFLADMGERPVGTSLERVDNDKGYWKNNCKWATAVEQCNNRSSNSFVTYQGKTQTLSQWARELGINRGTIAGRVSRYGYNPEIIFAKPSM